MKSFLVLIILIFLTACTNIEYTYSPENYKNSDISISAYYIIKLLKIYFKNKITCVF